MIKIYIENNENFNLNKVCEKLNLTEEENYALIYSENGIYKLQHKKVYKLKIDIEDNKFSTVKGINFIIDPTMISYNLISSQLPTQFNMIKIKKKIYTSKYFKNIDFCLLYENDNLIEYFIQFKKENFSSNIFEDYIISLL